MITRRKFFASCACFFAFGVLGGYGLNMANFTRRQILIGCVGLILGGVAGGYGFVKSPRFGALPKGVFHSPHYFNGEFHNLVETQIITGKKGSPIFSWIKFLFRDSQNTIPPGNVPSVRLDLKTIHDDGLIWLGHSSFLLFLGGKVIAIDPVLSNYASPIWLANRAFAGSSPYTAEDMPNIDLLLISHDHWDHLDYPTLSAIKSKIKRTACPLGVGTHLKRWGYSNIIEGDWYDTLHLDGIDISITPSQHFSGRTFIRNKTLWCGFVIQSNGKNIYFSGDGGYGEHFKEIGKKYGSFDCALIECGQYNTEWSQIHMLPDQSVLAASDVNTKVAIPMHNGKFCIAYHSWDEPPKKFTELANKKPFKVSTPTIGEFIVPWDNPKTDQWWTKVI